jgi:hypothetical protein
LATDATQQPGKLNIGYDLFGNSLTIRGVQQQQQRLQFHSRQPQVPSPLSYGSFAAPAWLQTPELGSHFTRNDSVHMTVFTPSPFIWQQTCFSLHLFLSNYVFFITLV